MDNPERLALDSMRTTAQAVGVTSTTMLRLARALGFQSYDDFKDKFQSQLVTQGFGARAGALYSEQKQNGDKTLVSQIFHASEQNIAQTGSSLDQQDLNAVAKLLIQAPNCYLVGSGILFFLASMMKHTGSMVLPNLRLVGPEYAVAAEAMGPLSPDDVVIVFGINPYAQRSIDAMQFANLHKTHSIAITDRPSSPIAEKAEFVFCSKTESPHYYPSMVAAMAIIEAMLATVVAEGSTAALSQIEMLEKLRTDSGRYRVISVNS